MKLPFCYYGNPILRQKALQVESVTKEVSNFIDDMIETLLSTSNGVGLAANQVGKLLRIFIVRPEIEDDGSIIVGEPKVYINPVISNPSFTAQTYEEGCLSVPKLTGYVLRPHSCTINALNEKGEPFEEHLKGFNAIEVMHENDHLNGVLFIDRLVDKQRRKELDPFLLKIKKKYSS